jgi:hypothetical protein
MATCLRWVVVLASATGWRQAETIWSLGYGLAGNGNIQFLQDFYPFHAIDSRMQKLDIDAAETGYFAGIDLPTMESPSK